MRWFFQVRWPLSGPSRNTSLATESLRMKNILRTSGIGGFSWRIKEADVAKALHTPTALVGNRTAVSHSTRLPMALDWIRLVTCLECRVQSPHRLKEKSWVGPTEFSFMRISSERSWERFAAGGGCCRRWNSKVVKGRGRERWGRAWGDRHPENAEAESRRRSYGVKWTSWMVRSKEAMERTRRGKN